MKSTADRDAWTTLETQTSLIEELDAASFTTTIEVGEAMLKIKLDCGDLLLTRAREARKGNRPPVTDLGRLVAGHLKTSQHLKARSRTFGPARVGQLTTGAALVRYQRTAGETILPSNEAQIRPLTRVRGIDDAERHAMWQEAKSLAQGGWPTPKIVQAVADNHYPREKKVKKVLSFDEWIEIGKERFGMIHTDIDDPEKGLVLVHLVGDVRPGDWTERALAEIPQPHEEPRLG